mgnify:FL=1
MRVAAILAVAVLLAAVPGAAHAERTIALSSGTFAFTVDAGGKGEGEVVVGNDGAEPIKVLVYVTDVAVSSAGEQTYTTPQREGSSLMSTPASWFRIYMPADSKSVGNTPYLEMEPGERIPIKFEFTPPPGTAPGDHNVIIFFEMFEFANEAEGSAAVISGRLGSRIALRVSGTIAEKLTIRPFEVPRLAIGRTVPYQFTLNNEGNINETVLTMVSLMGSSETTLTASQVATETTVFAGAGQQFTGDLTSPEAGFGPHTVWVNTIYTPSDAVTPTEVIEQRTVWLIPLWAVVLVGFLVAYSALYFIWQAARRRRVHRKAAAARRRSHRERDLEAEERRRRREERAAQAAQEMSATGRNEAERL